MSIVENHTRDLCQTKLFACPIGNLAFKQRVIERGNPFKFAHKLLTKFLKGVLQSCQICWHFSLSLLEKGLHPSFIYTVGLKSYSSWLIDQSKCQATMLARQRRYKMRFTEVCVCLTRENMKKKYP